MEALVNDLQYKSSGFKGLDCLLLLNYINTRKLICQISIVFSCWTTTLDLVSLHLHRKGIPYQRIDGDQVLPVRQSNRDRFVTDDSIPILLMSTGVGAFGYEFPLICYNLTEWL